MEKLYSKLSGAIRAAAVSGSVAFLAACSSPSDPDNGTSLSQTSVSGIAIDGYLARATIYADINNDGKKNSGEPSAITDSEGYFTTSSDGTDYCASAATQQFCLQLLGNLPDSIVLRTSGGFDVFTGEPFIGELAASVEPAEDGTIPNQNITPLSSVLVGASSDVLMNLNLTANQVNSDFIGASEFDAEAANKAFGLHKATAILADLFEDTYSYFGEISFFPEGASKFIYEAFATQLETSGTLDSSAITSVVSAVDAAIISHYNTNKSDSDSSISSGLGSSARAAAINNVVEILGLVDTAVPVTGLTQDQIRARMIGVEMVVSQMTGDASNAVVDAAIDAVEDIDDGAIYDALGDGTSIDYTALVNVDYSGTPSFDSVSITGDSFFSDLADKELYVSYQDGQEAGAALFLFDGESSDSETGDLKLCIRYDDNDGTVEENETEGALFNLGEWSKIDDRRVIVSLLGNFDFTLISRGTTENGGRIFSLSYSGETQTWETDSASLDSISTDSSAMETNADCRTRLQDLS